MRTSTSKAAVLQFPAPAKGRKRNATSLGARGELSLECLSDAHVTDNLVPLNAGPKFAGLPERTPEMALIVAMFDAMPKRYFRGVFATMRTMSERNPNCEATQKAANLADEVALIKLR
jgi:hypothetical protein